MKFIFDCKAIISRVNLVLKDLLCVEQSDVPGKGVRSHAHRLVHASQHWEVRLIVHLFIKNQLLFTIAPGISNHGLEQLTSVTHFDEQNME